MQKLKITAIVGIILTIIACKPKNDNIVEEKYPNGITKSKIEVKDGKRNGLTQNYDERGRLVSTAELVDDKYEGWMVNYNPENGAVTARSFYKDDKQNGPVTLNYKTGKLYREMTYKNGRVDSIVKTYWANGNLQAEVYFKMGQPSIGLKEWDKDGKPVEQPHIVVKEINQAALLNKIKVKIYLSDESSKVEFYKGKLEEGKYIHDDLAGFHSVDGVATIDYVVPRGHTLMEKLNITARTRTKYGNTLVLHRIYNLAVSN